MMNREIFTSRRITHMDPNDDLFTRLMLFEKKINKTVIMNPITMITMIIIGKIKIKL